MKPKTLDCVEMEHRGSERIHEATQNMTAEQKIAYWRERSRQFREEQERLSGKLETPSIYNAFGKAEQPQTAEDLDSRLAEERAAWDNP